MKKGTFAAKIKRSKFPLSLLFVYFGVMLLMSGIHYGIVTLIQVSGWNDFWNVNIPMVYWFLVALGLTLFTRKRVREVYEKPMRELAEATEQVAGGDFSVYVPPVHAADKLDYMDTMIADFNKMVEELGSVETLKTEFFSNVSHEIKTPISIIQSNAELLKGQELSDEGRKIADNIFWAAKRLSDLISTMLKLNKLENQTIVAKAEPYDLCEQLAECALNFEDVWERRDIDFEAEMEDSCLVYADAPLMELVWDNLFSNAVKFTDIGGQIRLRQWTEEDGTIKVSVEDNGCGMSRETRRHIFDKFYQGDSSHSMAGNGLGLSLVMRVLQLAGYGIEVQSELGCGSIFTVIISGKDGEWAWQRT